MSEIQHSIKLAAQKSGLTPHVIRIWEKRYDAVSPHRTDTNRRRYSEAEIERLTLLRAATHSGHSIGHVARLPIEKLRELVGELPPPQPPSDARPSQTAAQAIAQALAAIKEVNGTKLEEILGRAAVAFGPHGLLEKIVAPLAQKIGDYWRDGTITAAQEHFASAAIRNFLVRNSRPYGLNGSAPTIVVGTPAGQLHELGAVMVAAAANDMGWRVVYLGTSLPAVEIAGAAIQHQARAVALSLVFPGDDPNIPTELENLRQHLPAEIAIIAGGKATNSYTAVLRKIQAVKVEALRDLYQILGQMRMPG